MRLINTSTLRLEEKLESDLPPYAILSHRWGEDEVLYEDLMGGQDISHKQGYAKFRGFCQLAASETFGYAWMDTCCINKTNEVELGEAINSMFRWYENAKLCVAYLVDVGPGPALKAMDQSVWFERGWTLQELLAPRLVSFYDTEWTFLGAKQDLLAMLSERTKIPEKVLSNDVKPQACSVAQRMSWAANRKTERLEDRAYSLMGLFNVHLSKIYGERENAFIRLQEEIIDKSDDETIFTWSLDPAGPQSHTGLFAASPDSFARCTKATRGQGSTGYHTSNLGLSITLETIPYSMMTYIALLHGSNEGAPGKRYGILIARLPGGQDQYARVMNQKGISCFALAPEDYTRTVRSIFIRQNPEESPSNIAYGFWLRTLEPPDLSGYKKDILSRAPSPDDDFLFMAEGDRGTAGLVSLQAADKNPSWAKVRWLKFGFDDDFNPMCLVGNKNISRLTPDPTQFEAALRAEHGSSPRNRLLGNQWLTAQSTPPSRNKGWDSGACLARFSGTASDPLYLEAINLRISIQLCPYQSPKSGSDQRQSGGQRIWTVDVSPMGASPPEWDRRGHQCEIASCYTIGTVLIPIGGAFCIRHANNLRAEA